MRRALHWPASPRGQAIAVYLLAQGFYLCSLAPTVLWGDDGRLQREAYLLELHFERASDHPLWVCLAHPFTRLPVGDVAFRTNLFTSLCAAIAVACVFAAVRTVTASSWSAATSAGVLLVSHTFWTHAVRTEVYSLSLALLAIALYLLLRPSLSGRAGRRRAAIDLLLAALAAALAVDNHVLMWLAMPGLALLAGWRLQREKRPWQVAVPAALVFAMVTGLYRLLWPQASVAGAGLQWPSLRLALRQGAMFLAYLGLQFPGPALLLVVAGLAVSARHRPLALCLGLTALANVTAALGLDAPDQYVFYILAYFALAVWAGLGTGPLLAWLRERAHWQWPGLAPALLLLVLVVPPLAYAGAPAVLDRLGVPAGALGMREIPGRPALSFFLWPGKHGYDGARLFALQALDQLPPGSALIADYTVAQPLLYMQRVEGLRPDVEVAEVPAQEQVGFALARSPQREVFLALTEPYYDIEGLAEHFRIVPEGVVYRLVVLHDDLDCHDTPQAAPS